MSSDVDLGVALARAARRAERGGELVAGLVDAWRRAFPDDRLEDALHASSGSITELSLCLRPRPENWTIDVQEIAQAIGVEPLRLEAVLRKAELAERLSVAHSGDDDSGDARLMAARDRDEGER
jgi:hypothetical protein